MNSQNDKRPLRILSANDLYNINEEVTGHTPFVRDAQVLQATVSRPYIILFGEEQFPSLLDKAAATMHSLAHRHPFVDGNKRTATRATELFLEANGIRATWEHNEAQKFVLQIAVGNADVEEIATWLADHTEDAG